MDAPMQLNHQATQLGSAWSSVETVHMHRPASCFPFHPRGSPKSYNHPGGTSWHPQQSREWFQGSMRAYCTTSPGLGQTVGDRIEDLKHQARWVSVGSGLSTCVYIIYIYTYYLHAFDSYRLKQTLLRGVAILGTQHNDLKRKMSQC